jgi:hypothetical protein
VDWLDDRSSRNLAKRYRFADCSGFADYYIGLAITRPDEGDVDAEETQADALLKAKRDRQKKRESAPGPLPNSIKAQLKS